MRSILLLTILLLIASATFSQASDFVTVKRKNNRTYTTYFPGSFINCETVYGQYIHGIVQSVHSDTVFVKQYDIRMVPTPFGVNALDTLGSYTIGIYYKDIDVVIIPRKQSFGYIKNGTIFILGGLGYSLLNLINGKYLNESITSTANIKSLGISLGVAGMGYLLNRLHVSNNRNGKKYRVEYVRMGEGKRGFE